MNDDNMLEWAIVIMGYVVFLAPSPESRSQVCWMALSSRHQQTFANRPRPADTLYEGAILKARLIFPEVSVLKPCVLNHHAARDSAEATYHPAGCGRCSNCDILRAQWNHWLMKQDYPLLPPKMVFDTEMWHPNGQSASLRICAPRAIAIMRTVELISSVYNTADRKGEVCVSILVSCHHLIVGNTAKCAFKELTGVARPRRRRVGV